MEFTLESRSGYLQKASGQGWADTRVQEPYPYTGGDLYVGKRYFVHPKYGYSWRLWRSYLSFDTSELTRLKRTVRDAYLEFRVKTKGSGFIDTDSVRVFSHGSTPWGDELEPADWDKCDTDEGYFLGRGMDTVVRFLVDPGHINKTGQTQFRLRMGNEVDAPTGDRYVAFYGADSDEGVRLVADTGYINDDIPTTLAEEVFPAWESALGVTDTHPAFLPTATNTPEIQIGWAGTQTADRQRVTVDIDYIERKIPAGSSEAPLHNLDETMRKKADLIRRIVLMNKTCKGLTTGIESISEGPLPLPDDKYGDMDWLMGARVTVTFIRPQSVTDRVHMVNEGS